jgi:hypothetical protein
MPVSAFPAIRTVRPVGRCWVRPDRRDSLAGLGLRFARDFLAMPGVVVSGHVGRNVSRVNLDGATAYLKREHAVRLRDRLRSWRDGFGWASMSAREAVILRHLEHHRLPGPRCLAFGEADGRGFLLVEAAKGAKELRALDPLTNELATRIGRTIARTHATGVDQPDLFAKHVLVRPDDLAVTILDWQRAVLWRRVPWSNRLRTLAALRATCPDGLCPDSTWDALMAAYLAEATRHEFGGPAPDWFAGRVRQMADRLRDRKGIRSQRVATTSVTQELVRFGGETICAVPEFASFVGREMQPAILYDPAHDGRAIPLPTGRVGLLRASRYRLPFGRWLATLRGRSWRSPELKAARLLFHLERHGIPAPKLLAYGQTVPRWSAAGSFVLSDLPAAGPVGPADETGVRDLVDRLHAAGCRLTEMGPDGKPFGVADGRVVVREVSGLRLCRTLSRRRAEPDWRLVDSYFRGLR